MSHDDSNAGGAVNVVASLLAAFDSLGLERPESPRREFLVALEEVYRAAGVVSEAGEHLPLWCDCRNAEACWGSVPDDQRPRGQIDEYSNGGMPLPWIGRDYRTGGVLTLGVNLREASGRMMEYIITEDLEGQIDVLSHGGSKPHGSWFAFGSARSAAAVMRSQSGESDLDVDEPQRLAEVLDRLTRVQGVKCSPEDHARSARTDRMRALCPSTYLPAECDVLQPGAVIAFGNESWGALTSSGSVETVEYPSDDFVRGWFEIGAQRSELFWMRHPSHQPSWKRSHAALLESLSANPSVPAPALPRAA